jgi:catechol 2,3-dioxygenase-like lactoylglutathione lyase family enzyme
MAQLDLVGMIVKDMAESLRFYRLLGLDIPVGVETEGHVEVFTPGGLRVAWDTVEVIHSFDPEWEEPSGQRMGLAFKCESPAEVDALYREVVGSGYGGFKEPWDAFWGQRYAQVVDPDGNKVDLFAAL